MTEEERAITRDENVAVGGSRETILAMPLRIVLAALVGGACALGCLGSELDLDGVPPEPPGGAGAQTPLRSPSPAPEVARCSDDAEVGLRPASDLRVEGVYAYQGVEVPLGWTDRGAGRRVDLVQGRDLLVRVFVRPEGKRWFASQEARAHLVFHRANGERSTFEDVRAIRRPSERVDLESTFNFYVPGNEFFGWDAFELELWDYGDCAGASDLRPNRYPDEGRSALSARATGPVRVRIVPIRFDADGSGRLPDTSEEHMRELVDALAAVFPVSWVELTVREPVGTKETELSDILNQLLQLRSLEDPPGDVSYYGLVDPGQTMQHYCRFGCVAGVAAFGPASGAGSVGVGVGYRGVAQDTFVHEMGHVYRLMHAPCGGPSGTDPEFPYRGATLGAWGYDARSGKMVDPDAGNRDFMSYCDPSWISDYNFQLLVDRLATVNGVHRSDRVASSPEVQAFAKPWEAPQRLAFTASPFSTVQLPRLAKTTPALAADPDTGGPAGAREVFRTLRVDGDGRTRWGVPVLGRAELGERVEARVLGAAGELVTVIDVFRRELSEERGALYLVPQSEPGWERIAIGDLAPVTFSESQPIEPFVP